MSRDHVAWNIYDVKASLSTLPNMEVETQLASMQSCRVRCAVLFELNLRGWLSVRSLCDWDSATRPVGWWSNYGIITATCPSMRGRRWFFTTWKPIGSKVWQAWIVLMKVRSKYVICFITLHIIPWCSLDLFCYRLTLLYCVILHLPQIQLLLPIVYVSKLYLLIYATVCGADCLFVSRPPVLFQNDQMNPAGLRHSSFIPPVPHCVERKFKYLQ